MSFFRKITAKPWQHAGEAGGIHGGTVAYGAPQATGLKIFLAVVSSLFFLFIVSYSLRMELSDWRPLADPGIMWLNTAFLVAASVLLQRTRGAAQAGHLAKTQKGLLAAGLCSLAFLLGQLLAWRQILTAGFYATVNPSYAFFYLLTALHGLHLAGGIWVLGKVTRKAWSAGEVADSIRLSVRLCSLYWHFLLLVWLVMFSLLLST